jgi:putative Holliday junction resolvase
MSRVLAIDYGKRRVGLALSDPTRTLATGLPTLERRPGQSLADAIAAIVLEREAAEVVVGLPLNMSGTAGARAEEVRRFADEIAQRISIPVHLWDERLSTVRAQRVLRDAGVDARAGKARVDRMAAVLILQNYLDHLRLTRPDDQREEPRS